MPVFAPPQSPFPNVFNYAPQNLKKWRAALAKAKAGTSNAHILCVGDSTIFGIGSNGTATGNLKPLSYPTQLANLFSAAGINAHWNSFCSDGSSGQNNHTLDARIAISGSWSQFTSPEATYASIGGLMSGAASNTSSKLAFTPTVNVDTFKVTYVTVTGGATFSLDINGSGTVSQSSNTSTGTATKTITGTLGANTLNLKWVSGGSIFIIAVEAWDSSKTWVSVVNAGWPGAASADWAIAGNPWSPASIGALAPDLTLINIAINDWNAGTSLSAYAANIQALITAALATGDVVLVTPNPSNPGPYNSVTVPSLAVQQSYVAALYALAQSNNLVLIDDFARLVSYTSTNGLGLNYDSLHLNGAGYADKARAAMNVIGNP